MSTNHTIRQMIIDENIPLLVKSLTGFNDEDENFKLCETYAFNRIASHRFLSVNSHEVRRRIEGIAERFMSDNFAQHGEKLKELAKEFVEDSLCINHYELDVQWSIVQFLLGVSKNPVAALSENKDSIKIADLDAHDDDDDDDFTTSNRRRSSAMHELLSSLIKHNIPTTRDRACKSIVTGDDDTDLSDWSDEEFEGSDSSNTGHADAMRKQNIEKPLKLKLIPFGKGLLKPPEKKPILVEFDSSKSIEWHQKNIQKPWWRLPNRCEVTILSEWCLLREIIWTLQLNPLENSAAHERFSKFFSLNTMSDEITVNPDVSLINMTVASLQSILSEFASAATKLYRFRRFLAAVFQPPSVNRFLESVQLAPHSIQCYANGVDNFLQIILKTIGDLEIEIIQQDFTETYTVIYLHNRLLPHFRIINILYDIHQNVYIDFKTNAGHVCAAFLFASLINEMETTAILERMNIAASLFLVSIRFYLSVFNNWWIEGRLNDWCSEFLIEKSSNQNRMSNSTSNTYQRRSISAGISRSLDAATIKERIDSCKIVNLFRDQSLDAGYILNILYSLNKLTEMKAKEQQLNSESQDIEAEFMQKFWKEAEKFNIENSTESKDTNIQADSIMDEEDGAASIFSGNMDALLSMAFDSYTSNIKNDTEDDSSMTTDSFNCYEIYTRISNITDFPMPLSVTIYDRLFEALRSRISVANEHVLRIFLDEYKVLDHLINLQRVFLFGAGDLMLTFYSKLFKSMNAGEDWNNSYLLTVQLDDVLTTRYPELHSLFSVEITAADSHVKDTLNSITDITINYSVRDSIRDVIHDAALTKYNEIFRFLLQVKWAIWTLETLQFPIAFRKRPPYQPLTLIDLIFKRLALVRNWIIYSVQCIHSHLMTFVIQSMGQQLMKRMQKTECLREIIELHDSYIDTIHQYCFRRTSDIALRTSFEQLLSLVVILRDEWNNLHNVDSHGDFIDGENEFDISATVQQVDIIEATYINCHCHIAEVLTKEVFKKDQLTLASLSAAFNCSCPY